MRKRILRLIISLPMLMISVCMIACMAGCVAVVSPDMYLIEDNIECAQTQLSGMLEVIGDRQQLPRSVRADGTLRLVDPNDWTSGFFPGCLWYMYEATGREKWRHAALQYTQYLQQQQFNTGTHDVGFMMYCSYGHAYRLTGDHRYKKVLLQSARSLAQRFNPQVGCIRSWDFFEDRWSFPVIIDNMMNLELLFWAARKIGDTSLYDIAVSHADTTLKNHFRANGSCWHVIDYDPNTGAVRHRHTQQGYSHDSSWARGQSWGLYGFTMCYRETRYTRYLDQARKIADYLLAHPHLPADGIPYWDYEAPDIPNEPRDASAGAIMCSALYELSRHLGDEGIRYRQAADKLLARLSSDTYRAAPGTNHHFILKHSVGSRPENIEVDAPLIYADYYFLEALLRKKAALR